MTTPTLSRRKRAVFAVVVMALASCVSVGALLAADVYLHSRFQQSAGVNVWGYRGPVVGRKKAGEWRIAYLGGSTAFGYGVSWNQAIPAQLEQRLNARLPPGVSHISVVNLAYNNEGAYSFTYTLDDYQYLDYDLVCLYEGYNDMMGDPTKPNTSVFRHDSPVFKLTGYLPIFPVAFREKASALRYGGDLNAHYREMRGEETKTVFHAGLANRTAAGALDATAAISESLERQLAKVMQEAPRSIVGGESSGCKSPWGDYCKSMFAAVDRALALGKRVLVITQPYLAGFLRDRHIDQQTTLAAALARRYPGNPRVQYVNAGDAVDITDPSIGYDRMHLTAPGNAAVAERLVEPVRALIQSTR
jgi:lysophospholipase L1-like esterase